MKKSLAILTLLAVCYASEDAAATGKGHSATHAAAAGNAHTATHAAAAGNAHAATHGTAAQRAGIKRVWINRKNATSFLKVSNENVIHKKDLNVSEDITNIANDTFYTKEGQHLKTAEFSPKSKLRMIGAGAFQNVRDLKRVKIPASVLVIGSDCFNHCRHLESVEFDDAKTSPETSASTRLAIGPFAFANLPKLGGLDGNEVLKIPKKVTSVGSCAFFNTPRLKKIRFEDNIMPPSVKSMAFYGSQASFSDNGTIHITPNVIKIGKKAFANCTQIKEVIVDDRPSASKKLIIGDGAFRGCPITRVVIPQNIAEAGKWRRAFDPWVNLGAAGRLPGQAQAGQAQPGQAQPGQAQPGQAQPGQAQAGHAHSGHAHSGHGHPGHAAT
ncbi:MAG: leucine-rich repeat protein [Holosporaceae bacterium]|jgi:hypothetical protein|nr:leucine-rich repeat protein [Holosporaceae bacterium]